MMRHANTDITLPKPVELFGPWPKRAMSARYLAAIHAAARLNFADDAAGQGLLVRLLVDDYSSSVQSHFAPRELQPPLGPSHSLA